MRKKEKKSYIYPKNINNSVVALLHVAFWTLILFATILPERGDINSFSIILETINIAFYAFIIYFNLYYLFPKYLKGKSLKIYIPALLLSVLLLTPIKGAVLYLLHYTDDSYKRQIILNLHYTFLSTFFVAGASTIFKILIEWLKFQREKKKLEKEVMQSELKFLKSQINPHFLFNTLNNVYSLALIKSDKTPDVVLKLSEILRYMLYECNEPKVKLASEVKYIENYLALEKLRQNKNLNIEFIKEGEIKDQVISPLLFTPFLENAFKHGVNKVLENKCVKIHLKVNKNKVFFSVENTKPDIDAEELIKTPGGIGLANVKKRLNLLYPNKYRFDIENTKTSYKIELFLELN